MGDLNGSANINNLLGSEQKEGEVAIDIEDQLLKAGQTYVIPMTISNIDHLLGFQYSLDINENIATTQSMVGKIEGYNDEHIVLDLDQSISSSWSDVRGRRLHQNALVAEITLMAHDDIWLSELLQFNKSFKNEIYVSEGGQDQIKTLKLNFNRSVETLEVAQNSPNPFQTETMIEVKMPNAGNVTFEIFNVAGAQILSRAYRLVQGVQQIIVERSSIPTSGVYFYKLTNGMKQQ